MDFFDCPAPSRRGDLEVLGYCMLQWLCGQLPWEDDLVNKNRVRDLKMRYYLYNLFVGNYNIYVLYL